MSLWLSRSSGRQFVRSRVQLLFISLVMQLVIINFTRMLVHLIFHLILRNSNKLLDRNSVRKEIDRPMKIKSTKVVVSRVSVTLVRRRPFRATVRDTRRTCNFVAARATDCYVSLEKSSSSASLQEFWRFLIVVANFSAPRTSSHSTVFKTEFLYRLRSSLQKV